MRVDDLVNSRAALGQRLEEFSFRDRIRLQISSHSPGDSASGHRFLHGSANGGQHKIFAGISG